MDMESISTASEGISAQTDMALPWEAKQAALLKIQEDHIMSTDHSPTDGPSSTALQVSLTFVRQSQFAPLVEHTALHQHFLGMQGCSVKLRDCMRLCKFEILGDELTIIFKTSATSAA